MCRKGLRTNTSIVIETAQCSSTHHVCMLIGYGAHAICPYMAFETCRQWRMAPRCVLADAGSLDHVRTGLSCHFPWHGGLFHAEKDGKFLRPDSRAASVASPEPQQP